jgi:hypothetical protein
MDRINLYQYWMLFRKKHLNNQAADYLQKILEKAAQDPSLALLIEETEHVLQHKLDQVDVSDVENSRRELVKLLDQTYIHHTLGNLSSLILQDVQRRLEEEGHYEGNIDGVYGPKTKKAFHRLRIRMRSQLEKEGFPIDEPFGRYKIIQILEKQGKHKEIEAIKLLELEKQFMAALS